MINYKEKLAPIKAFVFDFDGVMTDGSVWTYGDGETVRCGNIKDGFALQYAVKKGYIIAVISGATSKSIDNRMASLGVEQCYTGCGDKTHKLNVGDSSLFNKVYCHGRASAGSEHRVNYDNRSLVDVYGKFAVIFNGLFGIGVAIATYMSYLCGGDEFQHAVHHSETGS